MTEIDRVKGIGPVLAKAFIENGFQTADKIATSSAEDLTAVRGVRTARAEQLIEAAQMLIDGTKGLSENEPHDGSGSSKELRPAKKDKKKKKHHKDRKEKKNSMKKKKKKKKKKKGKKK